MDDMSGGNCSTKNHTLSQHDSDSNNGDMSSGYGFINRHTLYQCDYSITFNYTDGDFEKGDVSIWYGSMNIHTIY